MAYLFIRELDSGRLKNIKSWALVYIHRYLRITPLYLFVLLFFWSLSMHLGSGPVWWLYWHYNDSCPDYWYSNILYLNNFIPDGKGSNCLGPSWYLANDMQFFIVATITIYIYHKFSKFIGWGLVMSYVILSIVSSWVIAYHFNLKVSAFAPSNGEEWFDWYYIKPYTRCGPYALGLACGMVLYTYRHLKATGKVYDPISLAIIRFI